MAGGRALTMGDGPLILWSYALAALLFGALALDQARRPRASGWTGRLFVAALALTALWALAIAGIGGHDVSARIAESIRNIGWLVFMFLLVRRDRAGNPALASVYIVVVVLAAVGTVCAVLEAAPLARQTLYAIDSVRLVFRMMTAVSALVLVHHLQDGARSAGRAQARLVALALAAMWGADLLLNLVAWAGGVWPTPLVVARGAVMVGVALILAVATRHRGDGALGLSRTIAIRSLAAIALVVYAGSTVLLTTLADSFAGSYARAAQAAIVFGATAALLTLFSTPWLRAWTRVKIAKHLFRHRYDYRVEWQRFTDTLGRQGEGAAPLDTRIVKAVADIVHSPAGPDAGARWRRAGMRGGLALAGRSGCRRGRGTGAPSRRDRADRRIRSFRGRGRTSGGNRRDPRVDGRGNRGLGLGAADPRRGAGRRDPVAPAAGRSPARLGGFRPAAGRRTTGGKLFWRRSARISRWPMPAGSTNSTDASRSLCTTSRTW